MNPFNLLVLLTLVFNLALASLIGPRATPHSPCAPLCETAVQDDTHICENGVLEEKRLEGCLTCLQSGAYVDREKVEYLAKQNPRPRSLHQPSSPIHRRAASPPLPKGAIAGIALGAALILALAASLAYLAHRKYYRRGTDTPTRSYKGPRQTTSSLDFQCRTRVTPMASRADFRRLSKEGEKGVLPGDALGSNPVLESTLGDASAPSPAAGTESSWNGQTLCSATSPPATSIKWASPAAPEPRTPTAAYSPHRISPYTLPSATPSSTRSDAPLLPARIYTPPEYGSASPSSYRSGDSGYGVLYPPGGIWEGPPRSLRTRRGGWDLHARSLEQGMDRQARAEMGRDSRRHDSGAGSLGHRGHERI